VFLVEGSIYFELFYVNGLKGRRKIISSLKEKLSKYNLSLLDISSSYVKEARLAFCFLAFSKDDISKKISTIQKVIEKNFPEIEYEIDYGEV